MISTADFRNGIVIIENGELMELVVQHVKPARAARLCQSRKT